MGQNRVMNFMRRLPIGEGGQSMFDNRSYQDVVNDVKKLGSDDTFHPLQFLQRRQFGGQGSTQSVDENRGRSERPDKEDEDF